MLSMMGQTCDVQGLHDLFQTLSDIQIVSMAPTYVHESGKNEWCTTFQKIDGLFIDKAKLDMGTWYSHVGWPVCWNRDIGIDHDALFVPFVIDGCTVSFETYVPPGEELKIHQNIVLIDNEQI